MKDVNKKRLILIVEDNTSNLAILTKILQEDYDVLTAENGQEALNILSLPKCKNLAAIVLDIVMPVMDGYEFLRQIKADKELNQIPVIVASSTDDDNNEIQALSLGANDFVTKPYKPDILKHRIANAIFTRENATVVNAVQKDSLTGIYSKEYFYIEAEKILKSTPEMKYDIICVDIERFKLINDLFGTNTGDALLKYIANKICSFFDQNGIYGRIGADRFACLTPHSDKYNNEYFSQIIKDINNFNVSVSINVIFGIYVVNDLSVPISAMCDRALLACNSIKGLYDTYFAYYDSEFRQTLLAEQSILDEMKVAIREKQFEVYYQPKYDIKTEKIIGAEALVRWNHPEKGLLFPGDFIPLFEKNGFISQLDIYVWDQVFSDLHQWISTNNKYVPISVNVSRVDIYNPDLTNILLKLVRKYNINPSQIHLEITETAYTENSDQLIEVVKKLKKLGFVIEMDDFGSGYSSLNMLSKLPLDILKLDRNFIQSETTKINSKNILSFVISLAKWMNLMVIAEGVETKGQLDLLKDMGCNYVQGYYYAKPMPKSEFKKHLKHSQLLSEFENSNTNKSSGKNTVITKSKSNGVMLIVDDVKLSRMILSDIFSDSFTIVEADNGQAAYDYIKKNSKTIDIIILNVVMPQTDGLELLKKLKTDNAYKGIPIVVTSEENEYSEATVLKMGADDFISKPYNATVVYQRINNVILTSSLLKLENQKIIYEKMKEMENKVKTDVLTGLYNRAELEIQVNNFFANYDNSRALFIIMDIDNFKLVNDRLGHAKGDEAIKKVAKILHSCFKDDDIVCRMGGDEFSVFIQKSFSADELTLRLQHLCTKLRFTVDSMELSCSIGACYAPDFGKDYQSLYHNADMALITAKRLGKNQYQIFDGDTQPPSHVLLRNMDWLMDEASDAVIVCDANNYELLYINDVGCKLANKDKKSCVGKKCYEAVWNKSAPCEHCININNLSNHYCEHQISPEGTNKSYIIKGKLVDWGGQPARIQYIQDNTAKATIAKQMMDISKDRKRLLDLMPGGIFRYSAEEDDTFDFVSKNLLKMLGYTEEQFKIKFKNRFSNMVYYKDRERVLKEINDQIAVGDTDECKYRIEKASGELCWVHDVGHLICDENSKHWFYVTIVDITSQHQMECELVDERKKLQIAIAHSGMQYWEHDLLTDRTVNGVKGAVFGFDDVIENYSNFLVNSGIIPPEYIELYLKNQQKIYDGAKFVSFDIPLNNPNGKQEWWHVCNTNIFDETGKPIKTIGTAENIDHIMKLKK